MSNPSPNQLAETLQKWLSIESISGNEAAFLRHLEETFDTTRWTIDRQPVENDRWNLVVTDGEDPEVLFCTHVDTVPPHLPVRRDGDRVYGRGACDTKGGLLAMIHAADRLHERGYRGIGFLLVVGEEVDHRGAKEARKLDLAPRRIILCEPTNNRVVRAQKGMVRFGLEARGVAAHSAFPDDGESAIHPLVAAVERIRNAQWPTDDVLGPTTVNVGTIDGGVAANVFAPSATAEVMIRAVSSVEPLLERIEQLAGDDVAVVDAVYNDPVFFDPPDGVDTCTVPFNTDAPYLHELADVWLVGPGDIRLAHSDDEHINLGEISTGIELYQQLARRLLAIRAGLGE